MIGLGYFGTFVKDGVTGPKEPMTAAPALAPSSTATMADYDFRPGGSLRLKTGVAEGGVTKKKKKKDKSKLKVEKSTREAGSGRNSPVREDSKGEGTSSKRDSKSPSDGSGGDTRTEAEKRFEEIQRRRMAERVKKLASQTHKDRVHQFNSKLEALSEHHDIPKVGPG